MHAAQVHGNPTASAVTSPALSIRELQETMLYTPRPVTNGGASSSSTTREISAPRPSDQEIRDHLLMLIQGFEKSEISREMDGCFARLPGPALSGEDERYSSLRRAFSLSTFPGLQSGGGRRAASWLSQFNILSGRSFKNLYRNPLLLQV